MTFLMFSIAARICLEPSACSRTALATWSVAVVMRPTVSSTSVEAWDCLAVASAIWPMSSLDRDTESMMFRSAAPALSASWIPCLASAAPERATSTAAVVSCCTWRTTSPISLAASTERSASFLTSSATTAKPRPASRARGLDGGIQCEEVGLVGDLLDHLEDAADLLRALPEAGDDAGGVLHVLGDGLHAFDRA